MSLMPIIGSTPAVVIRHLSGDVPLRTLLEAKTPHGVRACALDLTVEIPELIDTLRAEGFGDIADELQVLADNVSDNFRQQGCLVMPIRKGGLIRLAVLSKWQSEIQIAALLERDGEGVREKLPGETHLDRLQTVASEYPLESQ